MAVPVPNLGAVLKPLAEAVKGLTASVGSAASSLVNIGKSIGNAFAPLGAIVSPAINVVASAGQIIASTLGSVSSAMVATAASIAQAIDALSGGTLGVAANLIKDAFLAIGGAAISAAGMLGSAAASIAGVFGKVVASVAPVVGAVGSFAVSVANVGVKIAGAFTAAIASTAQLTGAIAGMLEGIANAGANALRQPFRVLDTLIASVGQGITRFVALYDPGRVAVFQYAVDSLYAALGKALAPAMDAVTQVVKALGSAIAGAGENGQKMIAAIAAGAVGLITFAAAMALVQTVTSGGILPILGALIGAFGGLEAVTGGLQPILDQLAPTLSGVMDVVGTALASASSAVGAILPTIAKAIEWAASVVGMLAGAFDALAPAIGSIMEVFNALMEAIRPVAELIISALVGGVQLIGQAIQAIAPYLIIFYETMGTLWKQVVGWIRELMAMIGIALPEFSANGTPKGNTAQTPAPVRSTSTGDVESVLRKARESAFSLGGGGQKPEVTTATNTGQTTQAVNDVRKQLNGLINDVNQILIDAPIWITEVLPNKMLGYMIQVANSVGDFAREIGGKSVEVPGTGGARVSVSDVVDSPATGIGAYNRAADFIQNSGGPGLPRVRF